MGILFTHLPLAELGLSGTVQASLNGPFSVRCHWRVEFGAVSNPHISFSNEHCWIILLPEWEDVGAGVVNGGARVVTSASAGK